MSPTSRPRASARFETLESRSLLTAYFVDSDIELAAINRINLAGGDQVLLQGGMTFNGRLRFDSGDTGTAANPVRVTTYDTETGLAIDLGAPSSERATLFAGAGTGVDIVNTAGIELMALNIAGSGRTTNAGDGVRMTTNRSGNVKLDYVLVDHVDIGGFFNTGILIEGTNGKSGFANVYVKHSVIHDNGVAGIMSYGVHSTRTTAHAHRNLYVGYTSVYNNTGIAGWSKHSGNGIVLGDVDIATIEHSSASNNGALNTHDGGPVGIWVYDANRALIQHNVSHHNRSNGADGGGFDFDGGVTNSLMQYNYSYENDGAGYGLYQYNGARAWKNNVVRFNVSVNDGRKNGYGGISVWNGGSGLTGAQIYNNTIIVDSAGASQQPWAVTFFNAKTVNFHFRNNNFVTRGTAGLVNIPGIKNQKGILFQGNNYFADRFTIKWDKKSYASISSWRSAKGQERLNGASVGTTYNPQFAGSFGEIASTSPLARSGLNLRTNFGIDVGGEDLFGTIIPPTPLTYSVGADWV